MSAKKRPGGVSKVLLAAMLGFADATGLDTLSEVRKGAQRIERMIDVDRMAPGPEAVRKARQVQTLPHYSGRVADLQAHHLAGSGLLLRHFSPRLLLPSVRKLDVDNSTELYVPPSDLVTVFDFEDAEKILRPGPRVVVESSETEEEVLETVEAGVEHAGAFLDAVVSQVKATRELSEKQADRIVTAIHEEGAAVQKLLRNEFQKLHLALRRVPEEIRASERVLVETPDTLASRLDVGKVFKEMPQRLIEDVADEGAKRAAKAGLKAAASLVKYLVVAALA